MNDSAQQPEASEAVGFVNLALAARELRLEYQWIAGDRHAAPLLVFLHEGLGSLAMWKDYPRSLCAAAGARGLVYSRAGYGRSTPRLPAEKWRVDFMHVEACVVLPALLRALRIEQSPWLFGHSDGASIALQYAAAFPEQVAGLIAIAPHILVEEVSIESIGRAREMYRAGLRERLARYHDDPDSAFWGWNDVWLDPAFRDWNLASCLPRIRCPVLAVQGENDEYGSMAQIEGIAAAVPHTVLAKLAGCGHSPHRDAPGALTTRVVEFMRMHGVDGDGLLDVARDGGPARQVVP